MLNFKKIFLIPALLLIIIWILFNPYIYYSGSEFISNFSVVINDFCRNINLNYRFTNQEILNLLRFLEYFTFGIISAILYKIYFSKIWANIANLLFLGLSAATMEIYLRNLGMYKLEAQDVIISFFEFCIGAFIILLFCAPRNKKIFSSKYKKNKYTGRN